MHIKIFRVPNPKETNNDLCERIQLTPLYRGKWGKPIIGWGELPFLEAVFIPTLVHPQRAVTAS